VERETRTKLALDKAGRKHRFSGIAQRESDGARKAPVSQKIGRDRCRSSSDGHRPFRPGTEGNQDACRNTGRRPEHCHTIRFCQQGKAKPRRQEICDTNPDRDRHGAGQLPRRITDGGPPFLLFPYSMKDGLSRHSLPFNHHTADIDAVAEDIGVVEDEVAPTQMSDTYQIVLSDHAAVDMFA
jgi:hypothetical protein